MANKREVTISLPANFGQSELNAELAKYNMHTFETIFVERHNLNFSRMNVNAILHVLFGQEAMLKHLIQGKLIFKGLELQDAVKATYKEKYCG